MVLVRISHNEKGMGYTGTDPGKRSRAEIWWGPWSERQTSQELRGTGGGHRASVQGKARLYAWKKATVMSLR